MMGSPRPIALWYRLRNVVPEAVPQPVPRTVPAACTIQRVPFTVLQPVPAVVPQPVPNAVLQPVPSVVQQSVPPAVPQRVPSVVPAAESGTICGTTAVPQHRLVPYGSTVVQPVPRGTSLTAPQPVPHAVSSVPACGTCSRCTSRYTIPSPKVVPSMRFHCTATFRSRYHRHRGTGCGLSCYTRLWYQRRYHSRYQRYGTGCGTPGTTAGHSWYRLRNLKVPAGTTCSLVPSVRYRLWYRIPGTTASTIYGNAGSAAGTTAVVPQSVPACVVPHGTMATTVPHVVLMVPVVPPLLYRQFHTAGTLTSVQSVPRVVPAVVYHRRYHAVVPHVVPADCGTVLRKVVPYAVLQPVVPAVVPDCQFHTAGTKLCRYRSRYCTPAAVPQGGTGCGTTWYRLQNRLWYRL